MTMKHKATKLEAYEPRVTVTYKRPTSKCRASDLSVSPMRADEVWDDPSLSGLVVLAVTCVSQAHPYHHTIHD